jgi:signal transduction histidine kinase/CheY-like chemotaxis protein
MTFTGSIALLSAGISGSIAILALLFSRAPGWKDQRWFALAALAGASYSALDLPTNGTHFSDEMVLVCSRLQFVSAALHMIAWLRYSSVQIGTQQSRTEDVLVKILGVLGLAGALTPAFLTGAIRVHQYPPLGAIYRTAVPTPLGDATYSAIVLSLLVPIVRLARAWRRRVPTAGAQFVALTTLLFMGVHDTLVVGGWYSAPYLLDVAFLLPAAAVGFSLTSRFVTDARAHEALRKDLEHQVQERTAELTSAQEALHRTEKLAALGQFAAGVAHEVNNPAAVVNANLHFLAENERDLSPQASDAVRESITAVQRIATIVRQLLDSGRLAASSEARTSVSPRALADAAGSVARARFGKRVLVLNRVPDDLWVLAQEGVLGQVVVNLVVNAVQAIPDRRTDGWVIVRGERDGDRVRVVVEDNGDGMDEEVLRHVFEPFFTTKPFGTGTGLGLAVSRGLVIGLGGDLRLESTPGTGTRATIELPAAPRPAPGPQPPSEQGPTARLRMLIVDDDASVLTSMRRMLELRYGIDVASNVELGLELLGRQDYDVVLCDVMMPGGGGERLYRALHVRSPDLARRVVFFTGGAVTDAARQFLRSQPQPILTKPLDPDQLARAAAEISPHH